MHDFFIMTFRAKFSAKMQERLSSAAGALNTVPPFCRPSECSVSAPCGSAWVPAGACTAQRWVGSFPSPLWESLRFCASRASKEVRTLERVWSRS